MNCKNLIPALLVFWMTSCHSGRSDTSINWLHGDAYKASIEQKREEENAFFKSKDSPLSDSVRTFFDGLQYFPVDTQFRFRAHLETIVDGPVFKIQASGKIADYYKTIGKLHFKLNGQDLTLEVYENQSLKAEGKTFYFVPFNDATNGTETYSGGRYLDFTALADPMELDFNKAYQPYCAYNHEYSCPVPPPANNLKVAITAGERL